MLKMFSQSSEDRINMITEGNLVKTFLFLSAPGIMMVMIQTLSPIIDGLLIYNYDDSVSGAAIAYCGSLFNIFAMGAQGLSSAGSAIIGQANGMHEKEKARNLSGQLFSISIALGIIFIPVLIAIGFFISKNLDPELRSRIIVYNLLLSLSFPFIVCQSTFNSVKTVFGHPETTFIRALIFVPIKICYTVLFVAVLRLGILGASLSAFFAYFSIMFFIVYDLFVKKTEERITLRDLKIEMPALKKFLKISWPAILQSSTKSLGFFLIKLETAAYGNLVLSAQSIANDVNSIFQAFTCCYDASVISMVSINTGAGNSDRAKKSAYLAIKIGFASSIILSVLCIVLSPFIIRLYTTDPFITDIAIKGSCIMALGFSMFSVMFNEMPAFIGLGLNKPPLVIQTARIWVIRLIALNALYFFFKDIGIYAVFISFTISNIFGGVISHIIFRKVKFTKRI